MGNGNSQDNQGKRASRKRVAHLLSGIRRKLRGPCLVVFIAISLALMITLVVVTNQHTAWLEWQGWSGIQGLTSILGLLSIIALIYEFMANRHRISRPDIEVWHSIIQASGDTKVSKTREEKTDYIFIENTGGTAATIVCLYTKGFKIKDTGSNMFKDVLIPGDTYKFETTSIDRQSEIIVAWVSHADHRVMVFQYFPIFGRVQRALRPEVSFRKAAGLWLRNEWWFTNGQEQEIKKRLLYVRKDREEYSDNIDKINSHLEENGYTSHYNLEDSQ